jgi:protein-disulfide isomerase
MVGYTFFLILLLAAHSIDAGWQRLWSLLFLLAAGFSLYSVVLAFISTYWIRSYCLMCIVSYAVNFALMYFTWLVLRRFVPGGWWQGIREDVLFVWQQRKKFGAVFLPLGTGVLLLAVFFPAYWHFSAPATAAALPSGVTDDGHPWIGAQNPELTIEEFTDYQCFQCKKMHFFLRRLVGQNPDKIRLVHRNYPLDHELNPIVVPQPYHVGSGKMALVANAAGLSGKFWEMNDLLFGLVGQTDTLKIKDLAEGVGMDPDELAKNLNSPKTHYLLKLDIWEGMRANMTGTPAYRIDGEIYLGLIPPDILGVVIR